MNDILKYIYFNHPIIQKNYPNFMNYSDIFRNKNNQIGGSKLKVTHENNEYVFQKRENGNFVILFSMDNKHNCVIVSIDTELRVANIDGINGDVPYCVMGQEHIGSDLLQITLKMLKKYHDKLKIDVITLTDNSYKRCGKNKITLSTMSILTSGDTWYGKHGFRPVEYDVEFNIICHEYFNKLYNKNKNIMNNIKLKDIDLLKYFSKIKNFDKDQFEHVKCIITDNPDMLIKDFLKKFLKNYNTTCNYFEQFYNK